MRPNRVFLLIGAAVVALTQTSWGQKASTWRVYKVADGLPEPACISVTLSPLGKVIARDFNLPLAAVLDGYSVANIAVPETGRSRIYGSAGGQLWTVVPEGLEEFKDDAWVLHQVPGIGGEAHAGPASVINPIPLCPVRQGVIIFLLPERLVEFSLEASGQPRTRALLEATQSRLEHFTGMALGRDGRLWIAGTRGLAKSPTHVRQLKPDLTWQEYVVPEALQSEKLQEPHEDAEGGITTVGESSTNHQKLVVHFDGQNWTAGGTVNERLKQAWRGHDRTWWAMTTLALFEWDEGQPEMSESEGISARQYYDVATEPGGAFWLATSDGLMRCAPSTWSSPSCVRQLKSPVRCLTADVEGRVWFISGTTLHLVQNGQTQAFVFPSGLARTLQGARAAFALKDGTVLIEAGEQLFHFHPKTGLFSPARETGNTPVKILGVLKDGSLCVHSPGPGGAEQNCYLTRYDGVKAQPFPGPPPGPAIGTNLQALFPAQNGDIWLSVEHGTACYHDNQWRTFGSADKTAPEAPTAFIEMADGRIWCATRDQVWEFDGKNWSMLRGGFDGINGMLRTRKGSVWVATENGLHRFFQGPLVEKGAWVENGTEEGLPSMAVREICEDQEGHLWAGTTHGLSLFHPEADEDPPQTSLQKMTEQESHVPEGGAITLFFSGQDKWKYTPRSRLLYSYRLDDHDWSVYQEANQVSFAELPAGKHYFQVRAMDRNCNVEPKPPKCEFVVVLPWYKESRLVLISGAGLVAAFFFAGLAFNRHRQLVRSYAEVEQKVAERTQQLEIANRELFHSQKMNALGTLAAGIAHDFNNILSIVKGSAQIIEDNLDDTEKIRTRADRIKTVVEQGAGIVKAMLGFSRESAPEPSLCDLNAVVEETLKLLGDRFLREVEVRFQPTRGLPPVLAAKDFIQQILLNFIFNAAESMSKNKHIILSTRRMEKPPAKVAVAPDPASAYLAISVQDFGCGILPENLPRIFEPFFTTKALSTRRGTGLGLSMAYELAKKMGAGLAVESVVDQGSSFTLILAAGEQAETFETHDLP
ncbi:MAG TPA: ATP-binding protein [Candidatus Binatia bacterium]|jgi:signal transduction histidine kinase/ligand-binding sensor domain-containing protein|nr:ATP-binding protein [Candidatus Binatia bacterium]